MKTSINGCSYTELWVNPSNWQKSTSAKALDEGYVEYYFLDPEHAERYPRGKPVRARFKKRLKAFKSANEKRAAITFFLEVLEKDLESGWNPVKREFMVTEIAPAVESNTPEITEPRQIGVNKALEMAFSSRTYASVTQKDIKSLLKYFRLSSEMLGMGEKAISTVIKMDVVAILENIPAVKTELLKNPVAKKQGVKPGFTDKRFNKAIAYLDPLFEELVDNGMIDNNPVSKIRRKATITEARVTLTPKECKTVSDYLRPKFPSFWLFMVIFYHSGGRENELLNLKYEDVDLHNLYYGAMCHKGGKSRWLIRPIKRISVKYWERAMLGAKKGDYIFSEGLVPGPRPIRADQISRRWRVHVKEKLGIKADFYAWKHLNLDQITASQGMEAAALAAGHTSTEMIQKHYAVGQHMRGMELVKNATNDIF